MEDSEPDIQARFEGLIQAGYVCESRLVAATFNAIYQVAKAKGIEAECEEILEIIMQMAVYAGFPAALEAVKTAATVFGAKE